MIRLLNYCLFFVCLCALIIIIVPLGTSLHAFYQDGTQDLKVLLLEIVKPFYNINSSLIAPIFLLIIGSVVLGLVGFYWYKYNYGDKKVHHYPVDPKWGKHYKYLIIISGLMLIISFVCFMAIWGANMPYKDNLESLQQTIKNRQYAYIGCAVFVALIGLGVMGYNSYINLMISYGEQKQFVDEQVLLGNYDPTTRRPYDENKDVSNTVKEINETSNPNEDNTYYGSSGLIDSKEKEQDKNE